MPARHLRGAERDRVAHEPQRRARREDELLLRLVLLQDVVLQRAAELRPFDAGRLGVRDEHREDHRGRTVDRHRRRDRAEVDAAVEVFDVGERVDGDAALPHLAERELVVGVAAHQRRQVERGRQAVAARGEQLVEAPVRVDRGAEAREHAHRPELRAVHRRRTARACTGTRPGARRRRARRRARPARPTSSSKSASGIASFDVERSPAMLRAPDAEHLGDAVVAAGGVAAVDGERLAGDERRVGRHRNSATAAISSGRPRRRSLCSCVMSVAHLLPGRACRTRLRASASR